MDRLHASGGVYPVTVKAAPVKFPLGYIPDKSPADGCAEIFLSHDDPFTSLSCFAERIDTDRIILDEPEGSDGIDHYYIVINESPFPAAHEKNGFAFFRVLFAGLAGKAKQKKNCESHAGTYL